MEAATLATLDRECQLDVEQTVQKLRKSQAAEFACAEGRLGAQIATVVREHFLAVDDRRKFIGKFFQNIDHVIFMEEDDTKKRELMNLELKDEVKYALERLIGSQAAELACAIERLNGQKESVLREYYLLADVRRQFFEVCAKTFDDRLFKEMENQLGKAIDELKKFKTLLKIADGFGSVPTDELKELYHWRPPNRSNQLWLQAETNLLDHSILGSLLAAPVLSRGLP